MKLFIIKEKVTKFILRKGDNLSDYLKKVLLDVFDLNADRASMEEISERIESGAFIKKVRIWLF